MKKFDYNAIIPFLYSVLSILLALIAGGIILLFTGKDPFAYFSQLFIQGMGTSLGLIETIIKMAPLLIVSAGLMACFSAGLWNVGAEGQFLIGAMLVAWVGPLLSEAVPYPIYLIILGAVAAAGGMFWILLPAALKAKYDINEIITSLMMTWVAINLVNWMVKGPINDPSTVHAQTILLAMDSRMPMIPFTRIHIGLIVGFVSVIGMNWVIKRTTLGYQFRVLQANRQAALHSGINVGRMTIWALLISGGFAGLAGMNDVLAIKGLLHSGWNPNYGMTCIPLVFLARMNGWAVIPLAFFFSFLSVGGEFVIRDMGVPISFVYVVEGLMLLFFAVSQYFEERRLNK